MSMQISEGLVAVPYRHPISARALKDRYGRERMQKYAKTIDFPHNASMSYLLPKKIFDFLGALITLIILSPLFLGVSIGILLTSRGSVIIRQKRVGIDGRSFVMYKFRTMHRHVDLYGHSPASHTDDRITRFGRFLRKTSMDELPQLANVLLGDMSIVGPRPEMPFLVEKYESWQRIRMLVKPGITGLWQICGRKDRPLLENIEYDLFYIEHQSLWFDIVICLRTVPLLITGKGAY